MRRMGNNVPWELVSHHDRDCGLLQCIGYFALLHDLSHCLFKDLLYSIFGLSFHLDRKGLITYIHVLGTFIKDYTRLHPKYRPTHRL